MSIMHLGTVLVRGRSRVPSPAATMKAFIRKIIEQKGIRYNLPMITIDDFAKVEMKVGLITEATEVEGSAKLIREVVDFGEEKRIIFSGIKKWYTPEELVGKKFLYVTNLEPKEMMGETSNGMILAVDTPDGKPVLVQIPDEVPTGSGVR